MRKKIFVALLVTVTLFVNIESLNALAFPHRMAVFTEKSFVVPLMKWDGSKFQTYCTGVIVGEVSILTAAHCIYSIPAKDIIIGEPGLNYKNINVNSELRSVDIAGIHRNYLASSQNRLGTNDIAMLTISKPFTRYIIAEIPTAALTKKLLKGKLEVLGFGVDHNGVDYGDLMMGQAVDMSSKGKKYYQGFNQTTQIAAGFENKEELTFTTTCPGDSGGPLVSFIKNVPVIVGVTSFGSSNCSISKPGFFMKTSYYADFIKGYAAWATNLLKDEKPITSIQDKMCDTELSGPDMYECLDADVKVLSYSTDQAGVQFNFIANGPSSGATRTYIIGLDTDYDGIDNYYVHPEKIVDAKTGNVVCQSSFKLNYLSIPRGCLNEDNFAVTFLLMDKYYPENCQNLITYQPGCRKTESTATDYVTIPFVANSHIKQNITSPVFKN